MYKRFSIQFVLLVFGMFPFIKCFCQEENVYFDHITTTNDLSQNSVSCILQDDDGFMWFGTQAGLDRYDGVGFFHYSNITNDINTILGGFVIALYKDKYNGLLWVGTTTGICTLDLNNGYSVKRYKFKNDAKEQKIITITGDGKGNIWIATPSNIYKLNNGIFEGADIGKESGIDINKITDFVIDSLNNFGIVGTEQGAFLFNMQRNKVEKRLIIGGLGTDISISKLFSLNNSKLLVGLENKGVYFVKYSYDADHIALSTNLKILKELKYEHHIVFKKKLIKRIERIEGCSSMLFDNNGNLWIGTRRDGLLSFGTTLQTGSEYVRNFENEKSLSSSFILSLAKSEDGSLWIGTDGGGVNKFSEKRLTFYKYFTNNYGNAELLPNNDIWSICQLNKNEILLGTDGNGIVKYSLLTRRTTENFWNRRDINSNIVRAMFKLDSSLLIGTAGGLFFAPLHSLNHYREKKVLPDSVVSILVRDGTIYVGTSGNGLIVLNYAFKELAHLFNTGILSSDVYCLSPSTKQDQIWVGTSDGIFRLTKNGNTFTVLAHVLNNYTITSIAQQNDTLWIGTKGNGLICLNQLSGKVLQTSYKKNFFSGDVIYGIVNDKNGKIWCSTNKGIFFYSTYGMTFNYYTRSYGLQHDEFNLGAYSYADTIDRDRMFFGGVNGINTFDPQQVTIKKKNYKACLLYLKNNKIDEPSSPVVIQFNNKGFSINPMEDYATVFVRLFDYQDPGNNKYKFQINDSKISNEQSTRDGIILHRSDLNLIRDNKLVISVRSSDGNWEKLPAVSIVLPISFWAEYKYSGWVIITLGTVIFLTLIILFIFLRVRNRKNKQLAENVNHIQNEKKKYKEINEELNKLNKELKMQNEDLQNLQKLLNDVSECENIDKIIVTTLGHLTNSETFNFDYAIFSEVDYFEDVVRVRESVCTNGEMVDPKEWKSVNGSFPLKSSDVMATSVREDAIIEVRGSKIITDLKCNTTLDMNVYNSCGHAYLVRLFVPVKPRRTNKDVAELSDRSLALLEIGFKRDISIGFDDTQKIKLCIYADNLALSYKALSKKRIESIVDQILLKSARDSRDNHVQYLQNILNGICSYIKAEYGEIVILSLNSEHISQSDDFNRIKFSRLDVNSVTLKHNKTFELFSFYALETSKIEFFNDLFINSGIDKYPYSSLSVPIIYENRMIGSAEIVGLKANFFNVDNVEFIKKIFDRTGEEYMSKKFHNAVSELVSSDYLLLEPIEIISPTLLAMQKYFLSDYVSVWMRDYTQEKKEFKLVKESKVLENQAYYDRKNKIADDFTPEFIPIEFGSNQIAGSDELNMDAEHKKKFVFFIHIPLRIDMHKYGFINIYSKRKLKGELFPEDKQFMELIANKTIISFLTSQMISKFSNISQSLFTKDLKSILQTIADSAREILDSEPVILFRYEKMAEVPYAKPIYSGFLYDKGKIVEGNRAKFIEFLLKEGKGGFYESEEELPGQFEFWHREKIESLAAIILKHEGTPVGLMCFNYRIKQAFSFYVKQLIKTFSALAAAAINNMDNIALIKKQKEELEEYNEKIEYEKDNIEAKLMTLYPSTNAASLAEIIRAVNHDIRNHLIDIEGNMFNIKRDSFNNIRSSSDRKKLELNIEVITKNIDNTTNLMSLFEPDSFGVSVVELEEIVKKVKLLFISQLGKQGIELKSTVVNRNIPSMRCSKAEISMIIYNLFSNAKNAIVESWKKAGKSKAGPEGFINLELDYDDKDKSYIIAVEDNGCGIDNEVQEKIFDLHFTTRTDEDNKGLGIGLYFVKNTLRKNYGGTINVKSKVGKGTKFELKFKQHIK